MRKKERRKKITSWILTVLLAVGTVVPISSQTAVAATEYTVKCTGITYSYYKGGSKPSENKHCTFSVSFGGKVAYCGEHGIPSPTGETKGNTAKLTREKYTQTTARKVLYYGYKGPKEWAGFKKSANNSGYKLWSGNAATSKYMACGVAVTSNALTYAYKEYGSGKGRVYKVQGYNNFMDYIADQPNPPSSFTVLNSPLKMVYRSTKMDRFLF